MSNYLGQKFKWELPNDVCHRVFWRGFGFGCYTVAQLSSTRRGGERVEWIAGEARVSGGSPGSGAELLSMPRIDSWSARVDHGTLK